MSSRPGLARRRSPPPSSCGSAGGPGRRPASRRRARCSSAIASASSGPSTSAGRCRVTSSVARPARRRAARPSPSPRKRPSSATRVSIIVLPTKCMRSSATPSARRFSIASSLCRKSSSESASATIRLSSSGIVRSKLRRPDSTWATGMPILAAVIAAARVELTSPGTITRSGLSASQHRLEPLHRARRLLRRGCPSRPRACGRARASRAPRRRPPTSAGRSAGRCGRRCGAASGRRARSAPITGAILTRFGRVPTT